MSPADLLAPPSPLGSPAPYALLVALKVLGFTLHALPMSLWYTGLALALVLHARGSEPAREWASRLSKQMPLVVAFGINFGVVPLLFLQVLYGRLFFTSSILMAWLWLAIVPLVILAYYGAYLLAFRGEALGKGRAVAAVVTIDRQEVVPHRAFAAHLNAAGAGLVEALHELLPVLSRKLEGGQGAGVVMAHGVVQAELGLVVAVDHQPAHARLFPQHAQATLHQRPHRAEARVERVEHFPRGVGEAVLVKAAGGRLADQAAAGVDILAQFLGNFFGK